MRHCQDILRNLPVKPDGSAHPHFFFVNTSKWSESRKRLEDIDFLPARACTVAYVGAGADGFDGIYMHKKFGCHVRMTEVIPEYSALLKKRTSKYGKYMSVHNLGVGSLGQKARIPEALLRGQGTSHQSILRNVSCVKCVTVRLVRADELLDLFGFTSIDLLHVNCEGCEYDLFTSMSEKWRSRINVIQIGTHNYPVNEVATSATRLCDMRRKLSETHRMSWGTPFVWERWRRRSVVKPDGHFFHSQYLKFNESPHFDG